MNQLFNDLSIKTKLTLAIMLSSFVLLVIIGGIVLVSEIYSSRTVLTQELRILANTLSANSQQSLVLGQYAEIDTVLESLIHQENIHAAYFFDSSGMPVAKYLQQSDSHFVLQALQGDFEETRNTFWTDSTTEHQLSSIKHFSLFTPVFYEGKHIGTLYLLSDMTRLYGHLSGVAFGITLSLLLMIFLSWILAGYFQKPVSVPLLQLAHLMENVSQLRDYSVRAEKLSHDEVGSLVDSFNRMLEQIESHQTSLAEHQAHLEQAVADRTTQLRAAVTDLKQARQQADTANEAKSHFLSRITHELRTPLIGVLGMNELLARTSLSKQQHELVETVQNSGEQLLHLISEVLDFSRIEAGKLLLESHEFDLCHVFEEVVALLSPQAHKKDLSLQLDISLNSTGCVSADERVMRQILMNLIGNAIKFTPSGSIVVSLHCLRQSKGLGTFVFKVTDTGSGMTDEVKEQVFDVFYQADDSVSGVRTGAGLGLAIVKQLVELMGGDLTLTSTSGQGSSFQVVVDLPFTDRSLSPLSISG